MSASETRDKPGAAAARTSASWDFRLDGVKKRFMARIARGFASSPLPEGQMKQEPAAATADRPTTKNRLSDPVVKARVQP